MARDAATRMETSAEMGRRRRRRSGRRLAVTTRERLAVASGHLTGGVRADRYGKRLPLAEPGHELLDLVADQLLPLEQSLADPLHHVPLRLEQLTDLSAAGIQEIVDLRAPLGIRQDVPDRIAIHHGRLDGSD